jgi:uncharacterized membrane protein
VILVEMHKRSVVKALTWRMIATLTTMSLVFIFTGDLTLAGTVGFFDIALKLFFYYLHERAWNRLSWGRGKAR